MIVWKCDVASSIIFIVTFSHQHGARSIIFRLSLRFGVIQFRLACVGLQSTPIKAASAAIFSVWDMLDKTTNTSKIFRAGVKGNETTQNTVEWSTFAGTVAYAEGLFCSVMSC